jgi:protein-tyrosine phosphatase
MLDWLKAGALIQVTASSLTGRFGQVAEQAAIWLLEHQWVHFIATDAHNTQSRPPLLRAAFDLLTEQYGAATAERLCIANPRAAFYGEPLEAQPGPATPHSVEPHRRAGNRPSFFGRLFKR